MPVGDQQSEQAADAAAATAYTAMNSAAPSSASLSSSAGTAASGSSSSTSAASRRSAFVSAYSESSSSEDDSSEDDELAVLLSSDPEEDGYYEWQGLPEDRSGTEGALGEVMNAYTAVEDLEVAKRSLYGHSADGTEDIRRGAPPMLARDAPIAAYSSTADVLASEGKKSKLGSSGSSSSSGRRSGGGSEDALRAYSSTAEALSAQSSSQSSRRESSADVGPRPYAAAAAAAAGGSTTAPSVGSPSSSRGSAGGSSGNVYAMTQASVPGAAAAPRQHHGLVQRDPSLSASDTGLRTGLHASSVAAPGSLASSSGDGPPAAVVQVGAADTATLTRNDWLKFSDQQRADSEERAASSSSTSSTAAGASKRRKHRRGGRRSGGSSGKKGSSSSSSSSTSKRGGSHGARGLRDRLRTHRKKHHQSSRAAAAAADGAAAVNAAAGPATAGAVAAAAGGGCPTATGSPAAAKERQGAAGVTTESGLEVGPEVGAIDFSQMMQSAVATKKKGPRTAKDRNWNGEYQRIRGQVMQLMGAVDPAPFGAFARLVQEFTDTATAFAKIIVSELGVPDSEKLIPPASLGGVAGGQKYVHGGIVFKFAADALLPGRSRTFMYGGEDGPSHHRAAKAAHNEIVGLEVSSTTGVMQLSATLMTLVTYRGLTVVCMPLLPISGSASLVHGSDDGGATFHNDEKEVEELVAEHGRRLNLAPHKSGREAQGTAYLCGDFEVHKGSDDRLYMLDFARVMPPENPSFRQRAAGLAHHDPRAVFYQLLRPEFVKMSPKPLNSDAFTGWNTDPNAAVRRGMNDDVTEATRRLYESAIPAVAAEIDAFNICRTPLCTHGKSAKNGSRHCCSAAAAVKTRKVGKRKFMRRKSSHADSQQPSSASPSPSPSSPSSIPASPGPAGSPSPSSAASSSSPSPSSSSSSFNKEGGEQQQPQAAVTAVTAGNVGSDATIVEQLQHLLEHRWAPYYFHARGLSLRHLGSVRALVADPDARHALLVLCTARTLKTELDARLRSRLAVHREPSDAAYKRIVADLLNTCFAPALTAARAAAVEGEELRAANPDDAFLAARAQVVAQRLHMAERAHDFWSGTGTLKTHREAAAARKVEREKRAAAAAESSGATGTAAAAAAAAALASLDFEPRFGDAAGVYTVKGALQEKYGECLSEQELAADADLRKGRVDVAAAVWLALRLASVQLTPRALKQILRRIGTAHQREDDTGIVFVESDVQSIGARVLSVHSGALGAGMQCLLQSPLVDDAHTARRLAHQALHQFRAAHAHAPLCPLILTQVGNAAARSAFLRDNYDGGHGAGDDALDPSLARTDVTSAFNVSIDHFELALRFAPGWDHPAKIYRDSVAVALLLRNPTSKSLQRAIGPNNAQRLLAHTAAIHADTSSWTRLSSSWDAEMRGRLNALDDLLAKLGSTRLLSRPL